MGSVVSQPVAILPDGGRTLEFLGVSHKLTSDQTGGAFYVCEAVFGPEGGSPLHIHHYEDEVIYVVEGEIDIRLDKEKLHMPAGGIIHLPKKIPHALQNLLKTSLRIIVHVIPGGWNTTLMMWTPPYKMIPSMLSSILKYQRSMGWSGWNNFIPDEEAL